MLTLTQVNCIREMFFEKGLNFAEISRTTGCDVKTVKKYIFQEDFNMPVKPKQVRNSKLDPFKEEIDQWLEADKSARKKQRHTAQKVFKRLSKKYDDIFDCSYRLVAEYVAQKKRELYSGEHQFFFQLQHIPGEAQVDFGEADFLDQSGVKQNGHHLNISFPHSNGGYTQLFLGENQQCLMEGLKNIFEHIGGAPKRIWFDNPSTIVSKVLKNGERILTEAFLRFKNHWGFTAAFCNVASGWEKGSVENKVGYHRRNLLVPLPRVDNLQKFNQQLLKECDADMNRPHYIKQSTIQELFKEDLESLLPLPTVPFDCSELVTVQTDSSARFTLHKGKHTYSTAPKYASTSLFAQLTAYDVIVLDENYREVIKHYRLYGDKPQQSMDWLPYLTQLSRRPAALKYSGIYELFPQEVNSFLDGLSIPGKKDILTALARLSKEADFPRAITALKTAVEYGAEDADSIIATFSRLNSQAMELQPLALAPSVPQMPSYVPCIDDYDKLFLKGGKGVETANC